MSSCIPIYKQITAWEKISCEWKKEYWPYIRSMMFLWLYLVSVYVFHVNPLIMTLCQHWLYYTIIEGIWVRLTRFWYIPVYSDIEYRYVLCNCDVLDLVLMPVHQLYRDIFSVPRLVKWFDNNLIVSFPEINAWARFPLLQLQKFPCILLEWRTMPQSIDVETSKIWLHSII